MRNFWGFLVHCQVVVFAKKVAFETKTNVLGKLSISVRFLPNEEHFRVFAPKPLKSLPNGSFHKKLHFEDKTYFVVIG